MNKILLFLIFGISVQLMGQAGAPQPLSYSENFSFPDIPKEQLYTRAKTWLASQFKDPNSIIQVENEEGGKLIGKASIGYSDPRMEYGVEYNSLNGMISYTITLHVIQDNIELTLSEFIHRAFPYGSKGTQNSLGLITTADTYTGKLYGYNAEAKNKAWTRVKSTIDEFAHEVLNSVSASIKNRKMEAE